MGGVTWIEDLKIRASAGMSGNDDIGEASATRYYESIKFRETVGLYPATVFNEELTYETVTTLNGGLDLALLGNRMLLNLDYFKSSTDNMIIFSPIDPYLGYSLRVENGGQMTNKGWEANLFYRLIDRGSFKWDVQANASSFQNEVTAIKGERLSYAIPGGEKINMVGEPANSFYGYIFQGVFATQAGADEASLVSDRGCQFEAGDAIYADLSGPEGVPDRLIHSGRDGKFKATPLRNGGCT